MSLLTKGSSGGGPFYPSEASFSSLTLAPTTFAALPSAASSTNKVYLVSDVGPAPGIELISNGTIWRPRGGRQVLAMRANNPVTVQSLIEAVAETIGPFPGGLVRAGMRLEIDYEIRHSGIGAGARQSIFRINAVNVGGSNSLTASGSDLAGRQSLALGVLSDTSAAHRRVGVNQSSFAFAFVGTTITVDFSAAWSADILLTSAAETAVNITSASWAAGIATFGTSAVHTLAVGDKTVIAGVSPSGYNVAAGAIVLSVPTTTSFTVAIASDPGAYTSGGTSSRISNMISQSYVLSLIG